MIELLNIAFGFGVFVLLMFAWAIVIALIIVPIVAFSMGIAWMIKHLPTLR